MDEKDIKKYIESYHNSFEATEPKGAFQSWIQCYKAFYKFCGDGASLSDEQMEVLCLRLSFYLASWGMFRGDAFIRHYDHMIHQDIIREILKPKYKNLFGITCEELAKTENLEKLHDLLKDIIKPHYEKFRDQYKKSKKGSHSENEETTPLSEILMTKILMGAMGCVPAFDNHFARGIKDENIKGSFIKKLESLISFYEKNKESLENFRDTYTKNYRIEYPQMKILDDLFFQIGYEKNQGKSTHKSTNVATV